MLSLEKLANANIKNRAEYSQLSTELNRLEKEKRNELRMVNNEIQRFKARYSKTNFSTDSPEASNVKMYETHNPGFCFKRNGKHRALQVAEEAPSVDFEHLHFLLFSNGEVDIEKILCLHLLSSHETDHLTPPRRPRTTRNFSKKDSPLEQLIERSEDNPKEAVLRAILPTYVLDINKGNPKRTLMDERLSARLLVNEKILELITTVVTALEHSNPEKVQHLISLAEDQSSLKKIFKKQNIQDFVMTLKDHSLVNSCSSFILTQPKKMRAHHLEIRTPGGALEDLVRFIRENVLQFRRHESWTELEVESREIVSVENAPLGVKTSVVVPNRGSVLKKEIRKEPLVKEVERFRRRDVNYIQKNIESIATYRRSEEDEIKTKRRSEGSNLKRNEEERRKSSFNTKSVCVDNKKKSISIDGGKREAKANVKFHLKQTKCPACMEKWKIPLPEPKVPKLVISTPDGSSEKILANSVIRTDSRRRVMSLIEKEEFKLKSYDRRYSNASTISQKPKKKGIQSSSLDLVALNILDLEKIRHEIREKETKKKLENFLSA